MSSHNLSSTAQSYIAGETFAATSAEYFSLKQQLESESFAPEVPGGPQRFYSQLPHEERQKLLKQRLKKYCQRVRAAPLRASYQECARLGRHCHLTATETSLLAGRAAALLLAAAP